ncbi:N-acetyl-gamma-glutamyl-phosphate reductase [Malonomonas rubra DSM 5091]|uniref:N-acetyl-gamma-glutamyl-phosphate reductase n=1 Tax=Malonomonas rubra DSM 5091 TaxID=1122189 RepID=A0A1M6CEP9_MALRU|nr:N-acetyl-gamma-glutamyl-phosphate reductase [Malonomonas rubra]SHI59456.1 N-acetyl-gamma-glutamyl-phosphate reductase [Malonomonas rubra DSM 5091]
MLRVAVVGASGYTGVELIRLLVGHPEIEISSVTSRQHEGLLISQVFPSLAGFCDLICEPVDIAAIAAKSDLVFTALPHKSAMEVIPGFLEAGCKVVDLSADYRLKDQAVYEQWYQEHSSPELLAEAVYGLPELFRSELAGARLVANPGCYPTSVALGLAPLLKNDLIDPATLIIDSKSGTSGAGRSAKQGSLYCEVNEGFKAYGVAAHRHTPEIEQTLSTLAGCDVAVNFTPHLLPINRGILSTMYATLRKDQTSEDLINLYRQTYADEHFVRVTPGGELPNVAYVRGTNFCDVGLVSDQRTGRVVVVSAIDNLVKGAAGQAIQNMNLICGFTEQLGLGIVPLFP